MDFVVIANNERVSYCHPFKKKSGTPPLALVSCRIRRNPDWWREGILHGQSSLQGCWDNVLRPQSVSRANVGGCKPGYTPKDPL